MGDQNEREKIVVWCYFIDSAHSKSAASLMSRWMTDYFLLQHSGTVGTFINSSFSYIMSRHR